VNNILDPRDDQTRQLLLASLEVAVPLWVERVRRRSPMWRLARASELATLLGEKGDVILFRSKKKGETAEAFNALAEAVAILLVSVGSHGFKFLGMHWRHHEEAMPLMSVEAHEEGGCANCLSGIALIEMSQILDEVGKRMA
jgi:hypothetical protein